MRYSLLKSTQIEVSSFQGVLIGGVILSCLLRCPHFSIVRLSVCTVLHVHIKPEKIKGGREGGRFREKSERNDNKYAQSDLVLCRT